MRGSREKRGGVLTSESTLGYTQESGVEKEKKWSIRIGVLREREREREGGQGKGAGPGRFVRWGRRPQLIDAAALQRHRRRLLFKRRPGRRSKSKIIRIESRTHIRRPTSPLTALFFFPPSRRVIRTCHLACWLLLLLLDRHHHHFEISLALQSSVIPTEKKDFLKQLPKITKYKGEMQVLKSVSFQTKNYIQQPQIPTVSFEIQQTKAKNSN